MKLYLEHEDILVEILNNQSSLRGKKENNSVIKRYSDGIAYAENKLFSSAGHHLELILYHDDFNVVNQLGNKVSKYKVSALCFTYFKSSHQRCSIKKLFLKISKYSQESTCVGVRGVFL